MWKICWCLSGQDRINVVIHSRFSEYTNWHYRQLQNRFLDHWKLQKNFNHKRNLEVILSNLLLWAWCSKLISADMNNISHLYDNISFLRSLGCFIMHRHKWLHSLPKISYVILGWKVTIPCSMQRNFPKLNRCSKSTSFLLIINLSSSLHWMPPYC